MKKDLKQLIWTFLVVALLSAGLYGYFARSNFKGICSGTDGIQESCTYLQYIGEPILVITLLLFGIFLFVFLLTALTRKLNKYGYYLPGRIGFYGGYPKGKGGDLAFLYPFFVLPVGIFLFFRAIKRWIMNQPIDYPR